MNLDEAAQIAAAWRAAGERIVMTNGVFDLLHVGHARYLAAARAIGDRLVVAVNSDESVRRLKGPTRPLLPEDERVELLLALRCVDLAVIFGESTADRALAAIRPDIYVKGGDYQPETIPETPTVRAWGGEVRVLPFEAGHSTTSLIQRIQEAS